MRVNMYMPCSALICCYGTCYNALICYFPLTKRGFFCIIFFAKNLIYRGVAQLVARQFWELDVVGSSPVTPTKNPSTLSADFLFKPIGLAYHHALACISLPHSCGVYHHTVGVYTFIGLMRCSGFATDDMQNLRFDDIQGFALIKKPIFMRV